MWPCGDRLAVNKTREMPRSDCPASPTRVRRARHSHLGGKQCSLQLWQRLEPDGQVVHKYAPWRPLAAIANLNRCDGREGGTQLRLHSGLARWCQLPSFLFQLARIFAKVHLKHTPNRTILCGGVFWRLASIKRKSLFLGQIPLGPRDVRSCSCARGLTCAQHCAPSIVWEERR